MIKIYSTTHCPYCKMAKDYFTKNSVAFEEYNVENDEKALEEMVKKSGQMAVPVIDIDGKILVGFDKEGLSQLLNIK